MPTLASTPLHSLPDVQTFTTHPVPSVQLPDGHSSSLIPLPPTLPTPPSPPIPPSSSPAVLRLRRDLEFYQSPGLKVKCYDVFKCAKNCEIFINAAAAKDGTALAWLQSQISG